jgi:hypothetical protein
MIYDQKINWRDPKKGIGVLSSTHDPFRSAVISYHADMGAAISDIVNLHFQNPKAYDVEGAPFQIQVKIAKALIGPTPDDGVWDIVDAFSKLRNTLAHSSTAYTEEGIKKTERQTRKILNALQKIRPEFTDEVAKDGRDVITWAAMTAQGFFREIREALQTRRP